MNRILLVVLTAFIVGCTFGALVSTFVPDIVATGQVQQPVASTPTFQSTMLAPADHIPESDINVGNDQVIISLKNPVWARFAPSGSMRPVLDAGNNAIEIIPTSADQIKAGDIVSYEATWIDGPVIHRVIETGVDQQGWFAILKGDNNDAPDPGKIRFDQVRRLVVAVIY